MATITIKNKPAKTSGTRKIKATVGFTWHQQFTTEAEWQLRLEQLEDTFRKLIKFSRSDKTVSHFEDLIEDAAALLECSPPELEE